MIREIRTAPKNSLILVMDQTVGEVPESMAGALVAATNSCVAVGTLSEVEGETLISLSDERLEKRDRPPVFDGVLSTPSKRLSVCSVLDEPLMSLDVPGLETRVQVWANDDLEPNEIRIVAVNHQT